MSNPKKLKEEKLVYYQDFERLLADGLNEITEHCEEGMFCCSCGGVKDDNDCNCVKRKSKRDKRQECYTSATLMHLDNACKEITEATNKIIESLKKESFICDCTPPEKI